MSSNYKSAFEIQHPMLVFVVRTVQSTLFSTGIKIAYKLNQQFIDYLAEKGINAINNTINVLLFSSKPNENDMNCELDSGEQSTNQHLILGIDDSTQI